LPDIKPGVTLAIRQTLEGVQPYKRGHLHHGLPVLTELDNVDKHRELVVVVAAALGAVSSQQGRGPNADPPEYTVHFTRKPLEDDEVFAVVTYARPYLQPNPTLKFIPNITFGFGTPLARESVVVAFTDFLVLVRDDIVPDFESFFPT
jgi:hypothetical protein